MRACRRAERCTASWKYHWTIRGAYQGGVDDVGVTPRQTLFLVFSRYVNKKTREFLVHIIAGGDFSLPGKGVGIAWNLIVRIHAFHRRTTTTTTTPSLPTLPVARTRAEF